MVNSPFLIQKIIKKEPSTSVSAFYRKGKFMKFITIY